MANIMALQQHVQNGFDAGRQRGERTYLGKLMGQAYQTDDPAAQRTILGQMAQVAPEVAPQFGTQLGEDRKQRMSALAQEVSYFVGQAESGNQAVVQSMYPQIAQKARAMGLGDVPLEYNPSFLPGLKQMAAAFQGSTGTPAQMQTFEAMARAAGLTPGSPEYQRAAQVHLGLEGRASGAAIGYKVIKGADGRERLVAVDPREPGAMVIDGTQGSFGGGYQPAPSGGPVAPPAQPPGASSDAIIAAIAQSAQEMIRRGVPEAQVDAWAAEQMNANKPAGVTATAGPALGVPAQPLGSPPPVQAATGSAPGAFTSRTPEEEAAAVEAAKIRAQLSLAPEQAAADAAAAGGKKDAELAAERRANAPKTIARYEAALATASNVQQSIAKARSLIGMNTTGFIGARLRGIEGTDAYDLKSEVETIKANLGFDRLQQMRDNSPTGGALGQVAVQELVALQSTIANLDPNQSDPQIRANLERVERHYTAWANAVRMAIEEERRAAAQQPQQDDDESLIGKYL